MHIGLQLWRDFLLQITLAFSREKTNFLIDIDNISISIEFYKAIDQTLTGKLLVNLAHIILGLTLDMYFGVFSCGEALFVELR